MLTTFDIHILFFFFFFKLKLFQLPKNMLTRIMVLPSKKHNQYPKILPGHFCLVCWSLIICSCSETLEVQWPQKILNLGFSIGILSNYALWMKPHSLTLKAIFLQ